MKTAEFKLVALRETAPPEKQVLGDTPAAVAAYWREQVQTSPMYREGVENFAVILLNTRRRITGHLCVSTGTMDTVLVHPREVFRPALIAGAAAIVCTHNHPSGDATPSEADIKVTRDLIRAGQLLKVDVLDHIVFGHPQAARPHQSLRELGFFYT